MSLSQKNISTIPHSFNAFSRTMKTHLKQVTTIADSIEREGKAAEGKLFRLLTKQCLAAPRKNALVFEKNEKKNKILVLNNPVRNKAFDEIMHQIEGTVDFYRKYYENWSEWQKTSIETIAFLIIYYHAGKIGHGAIIESLFRHMTLRATNLE